MPKMEPITYKWYDYLRQGKIMGLRCKECGTYEFPPVPVCNNCSSMDMEWTEMSGEAHITAATYVAMGVYPYSTEPVVSATLKLKEGPFFVSWIPGGTQEQARELFDRKDPVPVRLKPKKLNDDVDWPVITEVDGKEIKP